MKKNLVLLTFLAIQSMSCLAQDNASVEKYLNDYKVFTDSISKVEVPTEAQKAVWRAEYSKLHDAYKKKYKKVMTDDQVERYSTYRGYYIQIMNRERIKNTREYLDSTSVKVGKSMKRSAKKISGVVKGLFKK